MKPICSLLLLVVICCITPANATESGIPLTERTTVRFATPTEAAPILTDRDEFINSLSRFDLQARLQRADADVTVDDLLKHIPTQILEWTDQEREFLTPIVQQTAKRLEGWELPFPESLLLIKTSGAEDAGAFYCRGPAVIIPESGVRAVSQNLLLHEFFHILSRTNPQLREQLYAIVGFRMGPDLQLPDSLQNIKITNPDAPRLNSYIDVQYQGEQLTAVPLLKASAERFDPQPGQTLFNYMEFFLLAVEKRDEQWQLKLDDQGQPLLLEPNSVPSYLDQIGRNTKYIIHPEEVLADNFVHLMNKNTSVATPRILEEMEGVLRQHPVVSAGTR